MKAEDEVIKYLSNIMWAERKWGNKVSLTGYFETNAKHPLGIELIVSDDYYYILEYSVHYPSYDYVVGDDVCGTREDVAEIDVIEWIHKYNSESELIEKICVNKELSKEIIDLLPSLSEIN